MYTIDGVTNKYKVFQEYYFEKNKVELTYSQALSYYSQLSKEELEEFAKYYQDETGYEIITANGTSYGENAQYTDTGIKKKKQLKRKQKTVLSAVMKQKNTLYIQLMLTKQIL